MAWLNIDVLSGGGLNQRAFEKRVRLRRRPDCVYGRRGFGHRRNPNGSSDFRWENARLAQRRTDNPVLFILQDAKKEMLRAHLVAAEHRRLELSRNDTVPRISVDFA